MSSFRTSQGHFDVRSNMTPTLEVSRPVFRPLPVDVPGASLKGNGGGEECGRRQVGGAGANRSVGIASSSVTFADLRAPSWNPSKYSVVYLVSCMKAKGTASLG